MPTGCWHARSFTHLEILLRELAGGSCAPAEAEGNLEVVVAQGADHRLGNVELREEETPPCSQQLVDEIRKRLSYRYAFQDLNGLASQTQRVSAGQAAGGDAARLCLSVRVRLFPLKSGFTPAERGTALHEFMQYADHERAASDLPR